MKYWTLSIFVFIFFIAKGQIDTIAWTNGNFLITDSMAIPNQLNLKYSLESDFSFETIYGNPEVIEDRLIVDSNYNYLSNQVNNLYGYTYYEFNGSGVKIYEEVQYFDLECKISTSYNKQGFIIYQKFESKKSIITHYYDTIYQPIKTLLIELNDIETDSLIARYSLESNDSFVGKPKIYIGLEYYKNGKVKARGTVVTPSLQNGVKYRIGSWEHFDIHNEIIKEKEYLYLINY